MIVSAWRFCPNYTKHILSCLFDDFFSPIDWMCPLKLNYMHVNYHFTAALPFKWKSTAVFQVAAIIISKCLRLSQSIWNSINFQIHSVCPVGLLVLLVDCFVDCGIIIPQRACFGKRKTRTDSPLRSLRKVEVVLPNGQAEIWLLCSQPMNITMRSVLTVWL